MFPIRFNKAESAATISVIIPVYKDLNGLKDTIGSLLKCRVPKGKDLEIMVVNDGADESISAYCKQQRLVEVSISPNKGSYHARNRGMEFCTGSDIGFVDADIFAEPDWVANASERLTHAPYVAGHINVIRKGVSNTVADYQQLIDFNSDWHMKSLRYGPTANVWVKRSLIEKLGGFNETIFSGGDMEFGKRVYNDSPTNQIYACDVVVNHPPRTLSGLIEKSKRLANGHNVIGGSVKLDKEFSIWASLVRNFGKSASGRDLPIRVQVLRTLLFIHRLFYKVYFKLRKQPNAFTIKASSAPVVTVQNHHLAS